MGLAPNERRFFATIEAPDERALRALQTRGLDLFRGTALRAAAVLGAAAPGAQALPTTGGLITLTEAEQLVLDGYRVTLDEEASRRARAPVQVIEFDQWLRELED